MEMTQRERAEAGLLYEAHKDPSINEGRIRSQVFSYDYNALHPTDTEARERMIRENFGSVGDSFLVEQPLHIDFPERVHVGQRFYSNYNLTILAGNHVYIGDDVLIGPDVGIYAAGHPLNAQMRRQGLEYAYPVKIGSNVWIGGGVKIVSGVTIGDNTVIAAGSVVTRDIPAGVLAGGVPCRVLRENIEDSDQ